MGIKKKKISELPLSQSLTGLYTIGTDANNTSVKVGLEFVGTAAENANSAADLANTAAQSADAAAENVARIAYSAVKNTANAFDYCFFPIGMAIPAYSTIVNDDCFTLARNQNLGYRAIADEKGQFPSCIESIAQGESTVSQSMFVIQLSREYLIKRGVKDGDTVMIGAYIRSSVTDSRRFYLFNQLITTTDADWHWLECPAPQVVSFDVYNQFLISFQNRDVVKDEASYITGITVKKVSDISEWYGFDYPQKYYGSGLPVKNSGNLLSYYNLPQTNNTKLDTTYMKIQSGTGIVGLKKVTDIPEYNGNALIAYNNGTSAPMVRLHVLLPLPYYLKDKTSKSYLFGAKVRVTVSDAAVTTVDVSMSNYNYTSRLKINTNQWQDVYAIRTHLHAELIDLNNLPTSVVSIEVAWLTMQKTDDYSMFEFAAWNMDIIEDYVTHASTFYGKKWAALGDSVTDMSTWMMNTARNLGMIPYVRACGSSAICFSIGKMAIQPNGFLIDRQNIYSSYDDFIAAVNSKGFTNEITSVTWEDYSNNPVDHDDVTNDATAFFVIETQGNSIDRVNTIPLDDIDIVSIMFYNDNSYPATDELAGSIYDYSGTSYVANFRQLLNKVHTRFPMSKVVLMLPYLINTDYDFTNNVINAGGIISQRVRSLIRDIAWTYGYPSMDLAKVIDYRTMQLYYGDIHVNALGQNQITAYIENEFINMRKYITLKSNT